MITHIPSPFSTTRLLIRSAGLQDVDLFLRLWNDPRVMTYVGFPYGLQISADKVRSILDSPLQATLDARLVVERKDDGERLGECKLGEPDADGLCETDVKLLPEFWGHGYGVEIKRALLDYLFTHTDCQIVQATPNVENQASIHMQEAVGGVRVGEQHYEFPPEKSAFTRPVHAYIYQVRREDWRRRKDQFPPLTAG